MSANTIGKLFQVTNWGESHGKAIGAVISGCPSRIKLSEKDIQKELDRRKPNQSALTTKRREEDKVEIMSGVFEGRTTGAPISLIIKNKDSKKSDYEELKSIYRPGHADYTYQQKYGIRDPYGGGRASARITAGNVGAGAVAKKLIKEEAGIEIIAYVKKIKGIYAKLNPDKIDKKSIEESLVRCPEKKASKEMIKLIEEAKEKGESVGGVIECIIRNVPAGLGEPIFDKLNSDLAKSILSINAAKGIEFGNGFECADIYGSENNDEFIIENKKVSAKTNNAGGILGGISSGIDIIFRVAFKPTPTISKSQKTINMNNKEVELKSKGRHDPCVLPRAVPIVEAMAAITLADHYLRFKAYKKEIAKKYLTK